jgi:hypothetical protein
MNQQFYTRQDLFFMQIWVGLGYRWVFVLRFTTQWVGLGWRFTTHNPHVDLEMVRIRSQISEPEPDPEDFRS